MGGVGRYGDWRRYAWAHATADKNMANWDGVAGR